MKLGDIGEQWDRWNAETGPEVYCIHCFEWRAAARRMSVKLGEAMIWGHRCRAAAVLGWSVAFALGAMLVLGCATPQPTPTRNCDEGWYIDASGRCCWRCDEHDCVEDCAENEHELIVRELIARGAARTAPTGSN